MGTVQTTFPQKTSFWDFKNKKVYFNKKEKIMDFLSGLIGASVIFLLWLLLSKTAIFIKDYNGTIGFFFFVICMAILAFIAQRRRYVFLGGVLVLLFSAIWSVVAYVSSIFVPACC